MELFSELMTGLSGGDGATLMLLALVDSTSMGTLVLPLVLLLFLPVGGRLAARAIALRVALYLAVIALFYWLLGLLLLSGVRLALEPLGEILSSRAGAVVVIAVGIGLIILSWWIDPKEIRKRGGDPDASIRRWVERAQRAARTKTGWVALALAAGMVEVATMLPYLAAIGGLGRSDLSFWASAVALIAYCVIMILPALVLAAVRFLLGHRVDAPVARLRDWAVRTAPTTVAWVVGIVGVVILVRVVPTLMVG